jgi:hypothetical protein
MELPGADLDIDDAPVRASNKPELSFDMWDSCTPENFRKQLKRSKFYKPRLVALLRLVSEFLDRIGVPHFAYAGTALAVLRENGKMIAHDSDIDLAIEESDFKKVYTARDELPDELVCDSRCPESGNSWWDETAQSDVSFASVGHGGKRFKFFYTREGERTCACTCARCVLTRSEAWASQPSLAKHPYDPGSLHVCAGTLYLHTSARVRADTAD